MGYPVMTQPPFDAYAVYCAHQRARGQPCPSREWWDRACAQRLPHQSWPHHPAAYRDGEEELEGTYR